MDIETRRSGEKFKLEDHSNEELKHALNSTVVRVYLMKQRIKKFYYRTYMVEREIKEAEDQKLRYLEEMSNLEKEGNEGFRQNMIPIRFAKCSCLGRPNG